MNKVESVEDALRVLHGALEARGCSLGERADVLDVIREDAVHDYQRHMEASLHTTDPGLLPDHDERTAREMACSSGLPESIRMWANAVTNLGTRLDELRAVHGIARGYIGDLLEKEVLASGYHVRTEREVDIQEKVTYASTTDDELRTAVDYLLGLVDAGRNRVHAAESQRDHAQHKWSKLMAGVIVVAKALYNGHDDTNPRCGLGDTLRSSCNCAETRVVHVSGLLQRAIEEAEEQG